MSKRLLGFIWVCNILMGCTTFKRDEPSPVGMFYPNHPIQGVYFTKDSWDNKENKISFSQPAEIKAVGKMTWNSLIGHYYPTALISPKLDHLPGDDWISTEGDYYATIKWLQANGRIVYTGSKTSWDYFWESSWGVVTKILIFLTLVYFGYKINRKYVAAEENKRMIEEKRKREEAERKIKDEQLRKEKEIERRKNIVADLINNLYKETEREVNKTLIPTLINEVYEIYIGLHSENMNDLITDGSLADFQNIMNSVKSELERLKKLAITAQAKGYSDEVKESDEMTKEKALEILGVKTTATKEEVKKAYRSLVLKFNTDQRGNLEGHIKQMLEDKMKEINAAKDYLSKLGLI